MGSGTLRSWLVGVGVALVVMGSRAGAQAPVQVPTVVEVRIEGDAPEVHGELRVDAYAQLPPDPLERPRMHHERSIVCRVACIRGLPVGAYRFALDRGRRARIHATDLVVVDRPGELHLSIGFPRARRWAGPILLVSSLVFGATSWMGFAAQDSFGFAMAGITPLEAVAVTGIGVGAGMIAHRRRLVVRFVPYILP